MTQKVFFPFYLLKILKKVQLRRVVVSYRAEVLYLAFVACWKGSINYLTCNGVL